MLDIDDILRIGLVVFIIASILLFLTLMATLVWLMWNGCSC